MSDEYFDNLEKLNQDMKWIEDIIEKGGCCLICGYNDNPLIIELHHIAGKNNSDITIPVCPTCHRILSLDQSTWPKDWTKNNNPPEVKLALVLRGTSDVLSLNSKILRDYSDKILRGDLK